MGIPIASIGSFRPASPTKAAHERERVKAINNEAVLRAKRDLGLREKRQAEQRAIHLEHRQHRANTIKNYTHDSVEKSLATAQKMRAASAQEVRNEEELIRQQIDDQRAEWAELGQEIHKQSTSALKLHDKSRNAVLKANSEMGRRGKLESVKLDRLTARLRKQTLEANQEMADQVRRDAGFEMLERTRDGLMSERARSAGERRRQAKEDAVIITDMKAVRRCMRRPLNPRAVTARARPASHPSSKNVPGSHAHSPLRALGHLDRPYWMRERRASSQWRSRWTPHG